MHTCTLLNNISNVLLIDLGEFKSMKLNHSNESVMIACSSFSQSTNMSKELKKVHEYRSLKN
jgi:hypothetical protein